jgi:hypothetical protein
MKGNIDATVLVDDESGKDLLTALEIKTGKKKPASYIG